MKNTNNISFLGILLVLSFSLIGCSKEEIVPVRVDFEEVIVENDYSVPVQVVLINKTEGADDYEWTFEGGSPASSKQRNPGAIVYNIPGTYTITLYANNRDRAEDQKSITLDLDAPVRIDFIAKIETDHFSPVTVTLENKTEGASSHAWTFEGGNPPTSAIETPPKVEFTTPGEHKISLKVSNERETYTKDTTITVQPYLVADFDWKVDFQDKDLQVPVKLQLQNKSTSSTIYQWVFEGGTPSVTEEENPTIVFNTAGTHKMTLIASNGKETKLVSKEITVVADTNIKVFTDIRFGINTAHNTNTIGSFFSAYTEKVYTKAELTEENGNRIDVVFFGLNADFSFNRFYAPDDLADTTFDLLPNATHTKFINTQEACACGAPLTVAQFDAMQNDNRLQSITVTENTPGLQPFDNLVVPRVVLFETADGRKGAIKIKRFVDDGQNSYIETDIKIQKQKST